MKIWYPLGDDAVLLRPLLKGNPLEAVEEFIRSKEIIPVLVTGEEVPRQTLHVRHVLRVPKVNCYGSGILPFLLTYNSIWKEIGYMSWY